MYFQVLIYMMVSCVVLEEDLHPIDDQVHIRESGGQVSILIGDLIKEKAFESSSYFFSDTEKMFLKREDIDLPVLGEGIRPVVVGNDLKGRVHFSSALDSREVKIDQVHPDSLEPIASERLIKHLFKMDYVPDSHGFNSIEAHGQASDDWLMNRLDEHVVKLLLDVSFDTNMGDAEEDVLIVLGPLFSSIENSLGEIVAKGAINDFLLEQNVPVLKWSEIEDVSALSLTDGSSVRQLFGKLVDANPILSEQSKQSLDDHLFDLAQIAKSDPEMALSLASSIFQQWDDPRHSERILERLLSLADEIASGQGLEAKVTVIRWFLQRVEQPNLRDRVQLRLGRLYYTSGDFGKAVVELPIEVTLENPNEYQGLAGLYKAISLIRLRQTRPALPLLEWVAVRSPVQEQRIRAALLLGRLHMLYQRSDEAELWLRYVVERAVDDRTKNEAQKMVVELERVRME